MVPVYLLNLPKRTDRLLRCQQILQHYGIDFTTVQATEHKNPIQGLKHTMVALFERIEGPALVLEDDVEFSENPIPVLEAALKELPPDFDLLFLGANVYQPMTRYGPHSFRLSGAVANHAVLYSPGVIKEMIGVYSREAGPTDMLLDRHIVQRGKSFITNPQVALQRPDYSDIERKHVDYTDLIQSRYQSARDRACDP